MMNDLQGAYIILYCFWFAATGATTLVFALIVLHIFNRAGF